MRVIDGDTIASRLGGRAERVRYIGIDTPETVKPDTPVQCYGAAARRPSTPGSSRGRRVTLVLDVEARDRYGRLLAYVYRADDGLFVNAALVRGGVRPHADDQRRTSRFAARFAALAREARRAGRGLWGACA